MKPLSLIFALSLAANAALVGALVTARRSPSAEQKNHASQTATVAPANGTAEQAAAAQALAAAAKTRDLASMRDQLRALGVPDDVVRSVIRALVYKKFTDAQNNILGTQTAPFWKAAGGLSFATMTKEQRAKMQEANRAAMKEMDELVGPDPQDPMVRRLSFLPPEKIGKVRDLDRDYSDLRSQIMSEAEGFRVPADEQKLAFLRKEQRKDLEALLTPEELEAYDLRNSPTADRMRYQLRDFDASDAEYKAIYAAQKAFDDRFSNMNGGIGPQPQEAQARTQAQEAMYAQLKANLGEERYNAYLRSQNQEYRALQSAAKRFNLPSAAIDEVYGAREQTVSNAQRIANDGNLTDQQRRDALASLAEQARSKIKSSLGAEVADAYLKSNMRWLDGLQRGQPISVLPDGNVVSRPNPVNNVSRPALPPPTVAPRG